MRSDPAITISTDSLSAVLSLLADQPGAWLPSLAAPT